MASSINSYAVLTKQTVPTGQVWVRMLPGAEAPGHVQLIKLLREESGCTLAEAKDAIEALMDGEALAFTVVGNAGLTSFQHACLHPFVAGITFGGTGVKLHPKVFATGQYAAAMIAAEADAADEPLFIAGHNGWTSADLGLEGYWEKNWNTATHSAIVRRRKDHDFWYATKENAGKWFADNRQQAVVRIREAFGVGLKPALRILAALIAGRVIRCNQLLPESALFDMVYRKTDSGIHWKNLHKPLLYLQAPYAKPKAPEVPVNVSQQQKARQDLDEVSMPSITNPTPRVMMIYQLREVGEIAYAGKQYRAAQAIAQLLLTLPKEDQDAESYG